MEYKSILILLFLFKEKKILSSVCKIKSKDSNFDFGENFGENFDFGENFGESFDFDKNFG